MHEQLSTSSEPQLSRGASALTQATNEPSTYTVTELVARIRKVLAAEFGHGMWVKGEIRNLSIARSGHTYFDIIEPQEQIQSGAQPEAKMAVALFRASRSRIDETLRNHGGMTLEDGMRVRIWGQVDFWQQGGRLQFYMSNIDPNFTLGELEAGRLRLLQMLSDEGVLSNNQALAFPIAPLRVGLVTSASSAAQHDFCKELNDSGLAWEVWLAHTLVQGSEAPELIASAITAVAQAGVDVIAVVRGGGSRTDLLAFDHETVARAIITTPVPIITGIGHEIDRTIADEVAHKAQKTPTACAAFLVSAAKAHLESADSAWKEIADKASRRLRLASEQLLAVSQTTARRSDTHLRLANQRLVQQGVHIGQLAEGRTRSETRTIDSCVQIVRHQATATIVKNQHRLTQIQHTVSAQALCIPAAATKELEHIEGRTRLLDPQAILARGWSITRHHGKAVRNPNELNTGAEIETILATGKLHSTVHQQAGQTR
ncbi:MAG: exodeoxyribonuclease VII large subunit [Acidimicrobiia bacterium]|nr:exodeoxyribonuclease VII large subunit [Acidimicrobiia bacterium]